MTGEIERTIVQPAADAGRDGRSHRLIYVGAVLFLGGLLWLAVGYFSQGRELAAQDAQITQLRADGQNTAQQAHQLASQVQQLGATPVVEPGQIGATGAPGAVGPIGPRGEKGDKGDPGPPGESPPCLADPAHCQGAPGTPGTSVKGDPGPPGQPGTPGKDGTDGKDGTNGTSVTRQYFDRNTDGECRNYNDFSDGRTRVDEGQAADSACAPTAPPASTTPAVLPPGATIRRRN